MRMRCSLLLILAAGCASDATRGPVRPSDPPPAAAGTAIKVTYYRFQTSPKSVIGATEGKKDDYHAEYYVMLSRGWKEKNGNFAREPFEKAVAAPFKGVDISDHVLEELVAVLKSKGWDDLPEMDLSKLDPVTLISQQRIAKNHPEEAGQMRYLTVETPTAKKTVCRRDVLLGGEEISRKFALCEMQVLRTAMQFTIQVSVGGSSIVPK